MWTVNKRYLDDKDFKSKRKVAEPFSPSVADQQILADNDPNFRVFNTAVNTFNDVSTSISTSQLEVIMEQSWKVIRS